VINTYIKKKRSQMNNLIVYLKELEKEQTKSNVSCGSFIPGFYYVEVHWERPGFWERLKAKGEEGERG